MAPCFSVLLVPMALGQVRRKRGPVSDSETAIQIGEAALVRVYGKRQIESEKPFIANLKDDVWTVCGTLHCSDGKGGTTTICVGGVAVAKISKTDGHIISINHTR